MAAVAGALGLVLGVRRERFGPMTVLELLDQLLLPALGLLTVGLGFYLLKRLWHERGKPGLVLVVVLMWTGGGLMVYRGVAELLGQ